MIDGLIRWSLRNRAIVLAFASAGFVGRLRRELGGVHARFVVEAPLRELASTPLCTTYPQLRRITVATKRKWMA